MLGGLSSYRLCRPLVGHGFPFAVCPWRAVPLVAGPATDPRREVVDELDAPSAARWVPMLSAACRSRSAGVGMVWLCARSVRGLLDRRLGSVADNVHWARRSLGPPWPLSVSSWKTTRRAGGGGVRLQHRERLGFLVPWRCPGLPPCIPEL